MKHKTYQTHQIVKLVNINDLQNLYADFCDDITSSMYNIFTDIRDEEQGELVDIKYTVNVLDDSQFVLLTALIIWSENKLVHSDELRQIIASEDKRRKYEKENSSKNLEEKKKELHLKNMLS